MIRTFPTSVPCGNLHLLNLECEATLLVCEVTLLGNNLERVNCFGGKRNLILYSLNLQCQWDIKLKGSRSSWEVIKSHNPTHRTTVEFCGPTFSPGQYSLQILLSEFGTDWEVGRWRSKYYLLQLMGDYGFKISDEGFASASPLNQIIITTHPHHCSWITANRPPATESSQGVCILHSGQGSVGQALRCRPASFSQTAQSVVSFLLFWGGMNGRERPGVLLKYFQMEMWGQGNDT